MKKRPIWFTVLVFALVASLGTAAYGQKKAKVIKAPPTPTPTTAPAESTEPDKVLYDKAVSFMKRGRYTEARLDFQTLINTYPDSEYLAKAKLGTADSYYKEGGTSSLVQAIAEYKDFITFFPFLDEAPYAQMQVAMGHYRMMEKSDRDNSQAEQAEQEFQTFLLKYPQSPLTPKAEQSLRDVQEVLADGEYKIGRYYYLRAHQYPAAYAAATARLIEVTERYPLYSQSDQALWMLGDVYMRAKQASKNEDDKNHWADLAGQCYDQILKNYPLSKWAPDAKSQLTSMGMAVPPADPDALERMKQEQLYASQHHSGHGTALLKMPMGVVKSNPDVSLAARSGTPNLSAPDDVVSATDVLKKGAAGPSFTVAASLPTDTSAGGAATDSTTPVETVPTSGSDSTSTGTGIGVEIIAAPTSDAAAETPATSSPTSPIAPDTSSTTSPSPAVAASAAGDPPVSNSVDSTSTNSANGTNGVAGSSGDNASQASQAASGEGQPPAAEQTASKSDSSTESTSKKKKGLKKIIPF